MAKLGQLGTGSKLVAMLRFLVLYVLIVYIQARHITDKDDSERQMQEILSKGTNSKRYTGLNPDYQEDWYGRSLPEFERKVRQNEGEQKAVKRGDKDDSEKRMQEILSKGTNSKRYTGLNPDYQEDWYGRSLPEFERKVRQNEGEQTAVKRRDKDDSEKRMQEILSKGTNSKRYTGLNPDYQEDWYGRSLPEFERKVRQNEGEQTAVKRRDKDDSEKRMQEILSKGTNSKRYTGLNPDYQEDWYGRSLPEFERKVRKNEGEQTAVKRGDKDDSEKRMQELLSKGTNSKRNLGKLQTKLNLKSDT